MDVVWAQNRPCLVREVRDQLSYGRPLAYTTVMTVLAILHGKGVLRREKYGRAWRYWPAERREEHAARLMAELLRSGGDRDVILHSFVDRMSDDDLTAIRTVVARRPAAGGPRPRTLAGGTAGRDRPQPGRRMESAIAGRT